MKLSKPKYIFVTGGVASSLGKGIISASIARLLQARGYSVTIQKLDPYINVDPGTLNPYEHGECYVTEDGAETDLDLGHYEHFIDENLTRNSNFTTGAIYQSLIARERQGDFLGGTVQVIPHVTNAIKERFFRIEEQTGADVVITGEGAIDNQTPYGKVPSGIARLAQSQGKPAIAIGGRVARDPQTMAALREAGIVATFGIAPGSASLPELLADTKRNVTSTCASIASLLRSMA